jgi:hypothetical protein
LLSCREDKYGKYEEEYSHDSYGSDYESGKKVRRISDCLVC